MHISSFKFDTKQKPTNKFKPWSANWDLPNRYPWTEQFRSYNLNHVVFISLCHWSTSHIIIIFKRSSISFFFFFLFFIFIFWQIGLEKGITNKLSLLRLETGWKGGEEIPTVLVPLQLGLIFKYLFLERSRLLISWTLVCLLN